MMKIFTFNKTLTIYVLCVILPICLIYNMSLLKKAAADIYMKVGKNGTVYFSNVPTSNAYKVFMITGSAVKKEPGPYNYKYNKIIYKAARKYGVNPRLVEAVIRTESGYNATAVSDKGAEGLMQLMPQTQRTLGVTSPFNPVQNIYAGTEYLRSLILRYSGNLPLALAAYNAGKKAVAKYGGVPPYVQTQNYVREVIDYYKGLNSSR